MDVRDDRKRLDGSSSDLPRLLAASPVPMAALHGPHHTVHEVNPAFCRLLEVEREAILGRPIAAALPDAEACRALLDRVAQTGVGETIEEQACSRPPDAYWSYAVWPVPGQAEGEGSLLLQITDATRTGRFRQRVTAVNEELVLAVVRQHALVDAAEAHLRRREAELEQEVTDRETLLRETHHRVKNNLQMLCDAIYLQLNAMDNPEQHDDLQATYSRIFAVARLYEHLHLGSPGGTVMLDEYLARALGGLDDLHDARIRVRFDPLDRMEFDVDRTVHVGLILTELVFNALKHAFPNGAPGEVAVRLRRVGDQAELQVRDNGVGLPTDLDLERTQSLGLRTVSLLAQRLHAKVSIGNAGGACVTITFPLSQV